MAGRLARAHRQRGAVRVRVASPPASRRLLEAGLGLRGLRRDRVPGLRDRRLGGRLLRGRVLRLVAGPRRTARRACSARGRTPSPTRSSPGPAIGFLQECLRWWDQWLKGEDTGIDGRAARCARGCRSRWRPPRATWSVPGRWVAEAAWPSPDIEERRLWLGERALRDEPDADGPRLEISTDLLCGLDSGVWCADGNEADGAVDQRGRRRPRAQLHLGAARRADRAARERARGAGAGERPPGRAARGAALRRRARRQLAARDARRPQPDPPATATSTRSRSSRARARAWCSSWTASRRRFPRGTALRLALSPAYWPWLWPAPEPVTLGVHTAEQRARAAGPRAARRGRASCARSTSPRGARRSTLETLEPGRGRAHARRATSPAAAPS